MVNNNDKRPEGKVGIDAKETDLKTPACKPKDMHMTGTMVKKTWLQVSLIILERINPFLLIKHPIIHR